MHSFDFEGLADSQLEGYMRTGNPPEDISALVGKSRFLQLLVITILQTVFCLTRCIFSCVVWLW